MIKAVIFDLDGVLVFTDKFHYQAWKQTADELGVYFDAKINHRLRGVGRMESLDIILERYQGSPLSEKEKREIADRKNARYRKLLETLTEEDASDEVRRTLAELRERGYKTAVGSSSKNACFILERVGLRDMFDQIADGTQVTRSKPSPDVFLTAARLLGEQPEACLVVEDAEAGIDAGIAGGMKTAAIGEAVHCGKADYALQTISDLLGVLE